MLAANPSSTHPRCFSDAEMSSSAAHLFQYHHQQQRQQQESSISPLWLNHLQRWRNAWYLHLFTMPLDQATACLAEGYAATGAGSSNDHCSSGGGAGGVRATCLDEQIVGAQILFRDEASTERDLSTSCSPPHEDSNASRKLSQEGREEERLELSNDLSFESPLDESRLTSSPSPTGDASSSTQQQHGASSSSSSPVASSTTATSGSSTKKSKKLKKTVTILGDDLLRSSSLPSPTNSSNHSSASISPLRSSSSSPSGASSLSSPATVVATASSAAEKIAQSNNNNKNNNKKNNTASSNPPPSLQLPAAWTPQDPNRARVLRAVGSSSSSSSAVSAAVVPTKLFSSDASSSSSSSSQPEEQMEEAAPSAWQVVPRRVRKH